MLEKILNFLKTGKGKTAIATGVSCVVLYLFPTGGEMIAEVADFLSEILSTVADDLQPAIETVKE